VAGTLDSGVAYPAHYSHAVRRGAITHVLTQDVPERVVGDRMNVSQEIPDEHHDRRGEEARVEQRREYLGTWSESPLTDRLR
jgi:hypothetical protein